MNYLYICSYTACEPYDSGSGGVIGVASSLENAQEMVEQYSHDVWEYSKEFRIVKLNQGFKSLEDWDSAESTLETHVSYDGKSWNSKNAIIV